MNLGSGEIMGSGSYPVRPGEPDCSYYIRTGLCRFGATCRFNHPPNRELVISKNVVLSVFYFIGLFQGTVDSKYHLVDLFSKFKYTIGLNMFQFLLFDLGHVRWDNYSLF